MSSRIVRSLFAGSLLLLLVALGCWYFAPPPTSGPEIEGVLRVGARETWMIAMGISAVLGLAVGLAAVKFLVNERSEKQITTSLLN